MVARSKTGMHSCLFFFSSRRRHTRCSRDWSSDVCSSDLAAQRGGRIVVIGSKNVPAPGPGAAAYSASKAALNQLARVAALEWAKDGIRINSRSGERRVGEEGRSRGAPDYLKKKKNRTKTT